MMKNFFCVLVCCLIFRSTLGSGGVPGEVTFNCSAAAVMATLTESYVRTLVPNGEVLIQFVDQPQNDGYCFTTEGNGTYTIHSYMSVCAAERNVSNGIITEKYKIRVSSVPPSGIGVVSQDLERIIISFECRFHSDSTLTLGGPLAPVLTEVPVFVGLQQTEFTVKMARYETPQFSTISTDSTILDGENVYIGLTLESAPGFVMQVMDCTAAGFDDQVDPGISLIGLGCPSFDPSGVTAQIYPPDTQQKFGFSFPGFTWNSLPDGLQNIWLSCRVSVCAEDPGLCLLPCFLPFKRRRSISMDETFGKTSSLSLGPFMVETPEKNQELKCDKNVLECSHHCSVNEMGEGVCACPGGFMLLNDMKTCYESHPPMINNTPLLVGLIVVFLVVLVAGLVMLMK